MAAQTHTDADQQEYIDQLIAENRELRLQIRRLKVLNKKKKPEFSKIIFTGTSIVTIAVTIFSCWMIVTTMDTTPLCYLIPAIFAEMASATAFYYTKAKAENKIKLMKANKVQPEAGSFDVY